MKSLHSPRTKISVCLATYNGAPFLRDQIASILPQLSPFDELLAVDDASSDKTVAILTNFRDPRIRILRHTTNQGVISTFEHALREARGDILFLADQDDIWRGDKVEKVLDCFSQYPDVSLVLSDCAAIDAAGHVTLDSWIGQRKFHAGVLRNLIRNRYRGCAMAFRRSLLEYALPFPDDIPMHDMWLGMVNHIFGKAAFIVEPLIFYRRHGNNATSARHAPFVHMFRWRIVLVKHLAVLCWRHFGFRNSGPVPQQNQRS